MNVSVARECDSLRWTQSHRTDIVKYQAIALELPAEIQHNRMLWLMLSLSLLHMVFSALENCS